MTVRVLLVDQPGPARKVARLLADEASLEIVEQVASVAEALVAVDRRAADVALLAPQLPDGDGLALCRELRLRSPDLRCLLLTPHADDETLFAAIMAGASGLAPRGGTGLVQALRIVGAGGSLLDQRTTTALLRRLRREREAGDPLSRLTGEERAVLDLIAEGMSNRQIAAALHLGGKDVKTHVSRLMGKLGLQRRTQLADHAVRLRAGEAV
ncbi:MAG TPA: response regulator transcription factor [Actinophytocola sp.]|jgi:DNA-binding NarL/FixJ family response regulator|uniref:response regulator transcription factor n=1 Tax=Actinophytocola sp. TaxID=1872138 RepID=UPI002F92DE4C